MEVRWGILPDMTGIPMLVRLVGLDVAKELTFTAKRFSGAEAFELGLATHLSEDPRADAFALAREIAGRNPDAIRGAKALLEAAPGRPRAEAFLAESEAIGKLIGSPNQIEAVTAEMEGRPPKLRRSRARLTGHDRRTADAASGRSAAPIDGLGVGGADGAVGGEVDEVGVAEAGDVLAGAADVVAPPGQALGPGGGGVRLDAHVGRAAALPHVEAGAVVAAEHPAGGTDDRARVLARPEQPGQQLQDDLGLRVAAHRPEHGPQLAVRAG